MIHPLRQLVSDQKSNINRVNELHMIKVKHNIVWSCFYCRY